MLAGKNFGSHVTTNADGDVTYESKTTRVVRGTESRTVAKWNRDGWEVVSQSPRTLRTAITFRRLAWTKPFRWSAGRGS